MKTSTLIGLLVAVVAVAGIAWASHSRQSTEYSPSDDTNSSQGIDPSTDNIQNPSSTVSSSTSVQGTPVTTSASKSVAIANFTFSPATITVKKGTTVTWTNQDTAPHTVTGTNGGPSSGNLSQGQTYSFTFNTVGTFNYFCAIHPMMKAVVIVTE